MRTSVQDVNSSSYRTLLDFAVEVSHEIYRVPESALEPLKKNHNRHRTSANHALSSALGSSYQEYNHSFTAPHVVVRLVHSHLDTSHPGVIPWSLLSSLMLAVIIGKSNFMSAFLLCDGVQRLSPSIDRGQAMEVLEASVRRLLCLIY